MPDDRIYDVIVVGAGHSGCEAALAAARMGRSTLLLTMNLDSVAGMPCNPSVGGPAKGHLVREIDALGGEMGRNTDRTFIQIRKLNTGKGPAVQALRAQSDKRLYGIAMKKVLERQEGLDLKQAAVTGLLWNPIVRNGEPQWRVDGVVTQLGRVIRSRAVVITTGTFLNGRIFVGDVTYEAGRAGEFPSKGLSEDLAEHGFTLGRLKTGTPPRIDARTIDFSKTEIQPGWDSPLGFSFDPVGGEELMTLDPDPVYPGAALDGWRVQMPCYSVYTNERAHEVIRSNLDRAPMFTGAIKSTGPRYCPSIEDKIVRFADKDSHQLFLEPEGFQTFEVYVQGANTSLPEDAQLAMLRSIPAMANCEMTRPGYAIEYDYAPSQQIEPSLQARRARGLYLAGQINGTTGYEEAAAQGLMAGINAALGCRGDEPLTLSRSEAYIGVMIDDLTTKEIDEPYRLHTSRAEYRLLLRQDNADLRLTPLGGQVGLASTGRVEAVRRKRAAMGRALEWLDSARVRPSDDLKAELSAIDSRPTTQTARALELLKRPGMKLNVLRRLTGAEPVEPEVAEPVELLIKYESYISQQNQMVERARRMEGASIPDDFDFSRINGLRTEARHKLERMRPATLGQASRVNGVTPADVSVLMVHLKRAREASPA